MNKLLAILGPTATGKTDLAISLAKKFNGEPVSCDSRQLYKGLDIGTGKLPGSGKWEVRRESKKWEVGGVNIWMYDVVSFKRQYTVADYIKDADKVIGKIWARGKLPIIVGGTGLYLKALLEGLPNLAVPVDPILRKKLQKLSLKQLQKKLQIRGTGRWQMMNESDKQNPRRLVRAIELVISQKSKVKRQNYNLKVKSKKLDILKIGLTAPRDILYQRVDIHVVNRINQGMIEEAKALHAGGLTLKRMRQLGLEYGILADYLSGKVREIEGDGGLIKIIQNKIHGFVRRQLTWFKKEKEVFWFDITNKKYPENVEKRVSKWYHQADDTKNRYLS